MVYKLKIVTDSPPEVVAGLPATFKLPKPNDPPLPDPKGTFAAAAAKLKVLACVFPVPKPVVVALVPNGLPVGEVKLGVETGEPNIEVEFDPNAGVFPKADFEPNSERWPNMEPVFVEGGHANPLCAVFVAPNGPWACCPPNMLFPVPKAEVLPNAGGVDVAVLWVLNNEVLVGPEKDVEVGAPKAKADTVVPPKIEVAGSVPKSEVVVVTVEVLKTVGEVAAGTTNTEFAVVFAVPKTEVVVIGVRKPEDRVVAEIKNKFKN